GATQGGTGASQGGTKATQGGSDEGEERGGQDPGKPQAGTGGTSAATSPKDDSSGCGCRVGGNSSSPGLLLAALLALGAWRRRRQ
ncbi:MAG TPA: MYXO-CTERM sorting domain-containing protein, partial [Polyangiaceae bacterium]|nr:MYXO-CTERM sorting domain-containing protein [Polyangiaceae bacterium]